MPFTKTTTSGMIVFLRPRIWNWRVTRKSLLRGRSKSKKRTVWLVGPSPRFCFRVMPWVRAV